ncbi:MAG: alpha-glucan family phosphorylase [Elusimicrobia bacterium]|nr:alpha-glucan family phosphorylase [Elusimicrobiota bacterium]
MKITSFNVVPNLPENLKALNELTENMWFTWNWDAIMLFVGIDEDLWHRSHRNPKWMLGALPPERFEALSRDQAFLEKLEKIKNKFDAYMNCPDTWFSKNCPPDMKDFTAAYFSMEYGIGEGLPIYSGGLGMLSGDHLKTASELGIPVFAVGLLYRKGYVQQVLNRDNWQVERYPENDWYNMPVQIVNDSSGNPLRIDLNLAGENVQVGIWRVPVGRNSLFLLDTNLPENKAHVRSITEQLYGGDRENRICQEIVLGVGGARALEAMGVNPSVYHVNEGHSAFLLFERIRQFMKNRKISFEEAKEAVWSSSVFTTHTPVIAGNEYFDFELVRKYMESYSGELGISWPEFLEIGKEEPSSTTFCMTILALRLCAFLNAVSRLHRDTTRDMWQKIWSGLAKYEIPIYGITNGVHTCSWISHEHLDLYKKYALRDSQSIEDLPENCDWQKIMDIDDREFWEVHMSRKNKLINMIIRERMQRQYKRLGADATVLEEIKNVLNPGYLTIGFARRFASYKRANLIFRNPDRLLEIAASDKMPVQFVFAGKAHQADAFGKEIIKEVARYSMDKKFKQRIVFVEDYNMNVARYMVQGVDVWLNNPVRPLEASGTSGMKAVINGVLNLSVLDGWWMEGYSSQTGWAVGGLENYRDDAERDYVESESIYNLLQKVIAPLYYDRGEDGIPHGWIKMMKNSIVRLVPEFNTNRMLKEYWEKFYGRAYSMNKRLLDNGKVMELAKWRKKIRDNWQKVKVVLEPFKPMMEIHSGAKIPVKARVWLGDLTPEDVDVQVHIGSIDGDVFFKQGTSFSMGCESHQGDAWIFRGDIVCVKSGKHDFAVRVVPKHPDIVHPYMPLFIKWNDEGS